MPEKMGIRESRTSDTSCRAGGIGIANAPAHTVPNFCGIEIVVKNFPFQVGSKFSGTAIGRKFLLTGRSPD